MKTAAEQLNFISEYASRGIRKFRAEIADLRSANEELQRQNDILTGRVQRLNALLVLRERQIDNQAGVIEALRGEQVAAHAQHASERAFDAGEIARLVAELAALNETCDRIARAGMREIDASQLGY